MDCWVSMILENSIVYDVWDDIDPSTFGMLKNSVLQCPGSPDDFMIGALIFQKLQSILGDAVIIENLKIETDNGAGIAYTIHAAALEHSLPGIEDWVGERHFFDKPWWLRSDGSTLDMIPQDDEDLDDKPDILIDLSQFIPNRVSSNKPAEIIRPNFQFKVITHDDDPE